MSSPATRALRLSWCGALLVGLVGCERRAPGPRECEAVAMRLVSMEAEQVRRNPSRGPILVYEEDLRNVALECLTTPFDRDLVECVVERRRDPRVCAAAFRDRQQRRREQAVW